MNREKIALIGTGFIGPVHLEALRRLGRDVLGVLGSSPEKSREAAKRFGLEKGYADFAELLADTSVSAVHVTSPNRAHASQAKALLISGKHVICEKPLAMTAAESGELAALAAQSNAVAAVCYNVRFYPLCQEIRERVQSGELGEIFHVTGSYVQDWLLHQSDFNWRVLAEEAGALRAVADIGTHWLDLIQAILGQQVQEVCADLFTVWPTRLRPTGSVETFQDKFSSEAPRVEISVQTEDAAQVLLQFERGVRGMLSVSQVTAGRKNCLRFEIAGSKGSLAWNSENPNELWLGHRDRPNELLVRDPALLRPSVRPFASYPGGHNEGFPDTFKQLFRVIYDYIDRRDYRAPRPFPTFADGHHEVLLCEAILRSHREHGWVKVPAN